MQPNINSTSTSTYKIMSTKPFATSARALNDAGSAPTSTQSSQGLLRRLASTPRGRATIGAVVVLGTIVDYEIWSLYGASWFSGKGKQ
jgi:hypothetical protein